jgi:hypothetical protein
MAHQDTNRLSATDRFFSCGGQIQETTKFSQVFYFADTRTGWVVGDDGTIPTTRDGGIHWEPQKGGTDKCLLVCIADAGTGWVRSQKDCLPSSCRHN